MANFGRFATFPIFSQKLQLRLTWNGQFYLLHNFSNHFLPKQLIFCKISKFLFWRGDISQFFQIYNFSNCFPLKWLKMTHNGHLFPKKWLTLTWNGQFHLICSFFNHFPPKRLIFHKISTFLFLGGTSANFPGFTTFRSVPMEAAQNDPQWPILPPKWLGLIQNGQFWSICNFFPKKWLRLTWNGQFHPICNFSNHFP